MCFGAGERIGRSGSFTRAMKALGKKAMMKRRRNRTVFLVDVWKGMVRCRVTSSLELSRATVDRFSIQLWCC